jgi:hypothetical protein
MNKHVLVFDCGCLYLCHQDILAYCSMESERSSLPYPVIADQKRELALALGMMDPDEKDKDGLPLTARCVRTSGLYPVSLQPCSQLPSAVSYSLHYFTGVTDAQQTAVVVPELEALV